MTRETARTAAQILGDLTRSLDDRGAPSLAWSVEHAPHGDLRSAVQALWDACGHYYAMLTFVQRVGGKAAYAPLRAAVDDACMAYDSWIEDVRRTAHVMDAIGYRMRRFDHIAVMAIRAAMPVAPFLPCERTARVD